MNRDKSATKLIFVKVKKDLKFSKKKKLYYIRLFFLNFHFRSVSILNWQLGFFWTNGIEHNYVYKATS